MKCDKVERNCNFGVVFCWKKRWRRGKRKHLQRRGEK
jgi:hypothetical protein